MAQVGRLPSNCRLIILVWCALFAWDLGNVLSLGSPGRLCRWRHHFSLSPNSRRPCRQIPVVFDFPHLHRDTRKSLITSAGYISFLTSLAFIKIWSHIFMWWEFSFQNNHLVGRILIISEKPGFEPGSPALRARALTNWATQTIHWANLEFFSY